MAGSSGVYEALNALSHAALAAKVGLSTRAVSHKIGRGMTPMQIAKQAAERKKLRDAGQKAHGDRGASQVGVKKRRGQHRGKQGGKTGRPIGSTVANGAKSRAPHRKENFNDANLRKEVALANLRELEEAKVRGELIPAMYVVNWMASATMRCRDIFMGLRDLADRIRQEADPIAAQMMVDQEVQRGLEELERFMERVTRQIMRGSRVKDEAA